MLNLDTAERRIQCAAQPDAVSVSVSEWYPYGVLRRPLPCVRNVDGFPVTIAMPVLILRMNGYRICPLFPLCSKEQMKVPLADRGPSPTRTLESLKGDHAQYLLDGGNIKRAKLHNNVISEPFYAIPVNQVHCTCNFHTYFIEFLSG